MTECYAQDLRTIDYVGLLPGGKMVLVEIERHLRGKWANPLGSVASLTIEHIMPQNWDSNWRLPDSAPHEDWERRQDRVHFLGNLTLVTGRLNSRMRDAEWKKKKDYLDEHNTLLLNRDPLTQDEWNEEAIERRGERPRGESHRDLEARGILLGKSSRYLMALSLRRVRRLLVNRMSSVGMGCLHLSPRAVLYLS